MRLIHPLNLVNPGRSWALALSLALAFCPAVCSAQAAPSRASSGKPPPQNPAAKSSFAPPVLPPDPQQTAEWLARLNPIANDDWRAARASVGELAGLPPGEAWAQVAALWPHLGSRAVKREILLAFVNTAHPDTLRVLLLAAGETDPELVRTRQEFTRAALLLPRDTPDADVVAALRADAATPLPDARRARLRGMAQAIATASADQMDQWSQAIRNSMNDNDELRQQAVEAGVVRALLVRVVGAANEPRPGVAFFALYALQTFLLSPEQMRTAVLPAAQNAGDDLTKAAAFKVMAHAGYAPGYDALKAALPPIVQRDNHRALFDLAQSVAEYGRPDSIPLLIGLIASDNTGNTVYDLGWFGLAPLTGVAYNPAHDGNWWKLWWETNRAVLPDRLGYQELPVFAHTPNYQEPLDRELHLDPEKYRRYALDALQKDIAQSQAGSSEAEERFRALPDPRSIPTLIGIMAADNSGALNRIGYTIMEQLCGVPYSPEHDGNWWRLWWEAHRRELPANARDLTIPDLPHSAHFRDALPMELHRDPVALREHLLADLKTRLAQGQKNEIMPTVNALVSLNDPNTIAPMIALYPDDPLNGACYWLGWFGLNPITGETWSQERDKRWWQTWLTAHRADVDKRIAEWKAQPSYVRYGFKPTPGAAIPLATQAKYAPQVAPKTPPRPPQATPSEQPAPESDAEDIADVPSAPITLHNDPKQRYRLVGLQTRAAPPLGGYKLLVVLPGGSGGDDFRDFVRRIKKFALPADTLVAQIVAPQWSGWQAKNLVWPTRLTPYYEMKFSTEALIEAAIADLKTRARINPKQVVALAWSSSGPAAYSALATRGSSLCGAFIAMSIFRAGSLPDPGALAGRRVFLYHSPQDFIRITQAREAESYLKAHGAKVKFQEYAGGHGWVGDVFGDIRAGFDWLTTTPVPAHDARPKPPRKPFSKL